MKQTHLTIEQAQVLIEELELQIEALNNHIEKIKQATPKVKLMKIIESLNLPFSIYNHDIHICNVNDHSDNEFYIKLPLPMANTTWTLEAYEWMKTFVSNNKNSYPYHNPNNDNSSYLYIHVTIY